MRKMIEGAKAWKNGTEAKHYGLMQLQ
jgi:hypothetical protein